MSLFIWQCKGVKPEYQFPVGLEKSKEKELKTRVNQGYKTFKQNCQSCHGITTKTKDSVIKLDLKNASNYQNNFIKGDFKNHAFTQGLTDEQLTDVLLFLAVIKLD